MNLDKIRKKLIDTVIEEMDSMKPESLKDVIVSGIEAIESTKLELDANPKYQEAKESVDTLSQAFKDTKAYQGAKIQYARLRLRETGAGKALDATLLSELAELREKIKAKNAKKPPVSA